MEYFACVIHEMRESKGHNFHCIILVLKVTRERVRPQDLNPARLLGRLTRYKFVFATRHLVPF